MNGRRGVGSLSYLPFIIHHSSFCISSYTYRTVPPKNILIFTAVRMETRTIQQALRGSACRVHTVGIGAKHLPASAEVTGVTAILMCGVAGGLDPTLGIGDVILDDRCALVPATIGYRRGAVHSATAIISSPIQKAEVFHETAALAVDMEQAIVRNFANHLGIPMIGIRAISDTADQTLDPAVVNLVDDLGRPRAGKIALNLIRRPSLIPYLRALNKNTNMALRELGTARARDCGTTRRDLMAITQKYQDQLVQKGYAVVPNFLTAQELSAARQNFSRYFPSHEELQTTPERFGFIHEDPEHLQTEFPFAGEDLNNISTHPDIIAFVERLLGTEDILLSQAAIWAKYAGTGDFEQGLHLDYQGNTLVVPREDGDYRQVNFILYYSDVTLEMGPTYVVAQGQTRDLPLWPTHRTRKKSPDLYKLERPVPGQCRRSADLRYAHLASGQ